MVESLDGDVQRPARARRRAGGRGAPPPLAVDTVQEAADGTRKLRFRTSDGRAIESVLIPDENRVEPLDFHAGRATAPAGRR